MTDIQLRPATLDDVPRICEISAQIWEGEDYAGAAAPAWIADPQGELTVALVRGEVVGFARFYWLLPGYAWFEGLRTDPEKRLQGAAKAITRYFLDKARQGGAECAALSTYVENHASIHIIESHGFTRVMAYTYCEADHASPARAQAVASARVVAVPAAEALPFIQRSAFLRIARGHLPHGWKFYPFARAPLAVLERMEALLGLRDAQGRLTTLLCLGNPNRDTHEQAVNFLEGDPGDMAELLRHALYLARDYRWLGIMLPRWEGQAPPALEIVKALGIASQNDYQGDVFVYEKLL